ncbi:MAG: hypothetical protein Ct9H300mP11_22570 [Chloroflexota bacterium]|nr:MAG: hypothetical protein Ct9H300mP11_22570 [Chloroflexota bacterium]
MVFNQSRVIPARLYGRRVPTGSKVEFLLLNRNADGTWHAMEKPGRRLHPGAVIEIEKVQETPPPFNGGETEDRLSVEITASHKDGLKTIRLSSEERIDAFGHTPLPPYIKEKLNNDSRYQTVMLTNQVAWQRRPLGSISLMNFLKISEIQALIRCSLHYMWGPDTFKPVGKKTPQTTRFTPNDTESHPRQLNH